MPCPGFAAIERYRKMFSITRTLFGAFAAIGFSFHAVGRAAMLAAVLAGIFSRCPVQPEMEEQAVFQGRACLGVLAAL